MQRSSPTDSRVLSAVCVPCGWWHQPNKGGLQCCPNGGMHPVVWPYCHQWQDRGETSGDAFPPLQGAEAANSSTQTKSKNVLPDCSSMLPTASPISPFTITCFTKEGVTGQNSLDFSAGSAIYWRQLVKRSYITTSRAAYLEISILGQRLLAQASGDDAHTPHQLGACSEAC